MRIWTTIAAASLAATPALAQDAAPVSNPAPAPASPKARAAKPRHAQHQPVAKKSSITKSIKKRTGTAKSQKKKAQAQQAKAAAQ